MRRPHVTAERAKELVKRLYNFDVKEVNKLPGYYDINFHVITKPTKNVSASEYVLKVLNSDDSGRIDVLEAHNEMVSVLKQNGIPFSVPVLNKAGNQYEVLALPTADDTEKKADFVIWMVEFIPGVTYQAAECPVELYEPIGNMLGRMNFVLKKLRFEALENYETPFRLQKLLDLVPLIELLPNDKERKVAFEIIQAFRRLVMPYMTTFQTGIIHGDISDTNIIVRRRKQTTTNNLASDLDIGTWELSGMIDLGDASCSYYVFEVAIAISGMTKSIQGRISPLHLAALMYNGYKQEFHLTQKEESVIQLCICSRFLQLLMLGQRDLLRDPENHYIALCRDKNRKALEYWWNLPENAFLDKMLEHSTKTSCV